MLALHLPRSGPAKGDALSGGCPLAAQLFAEGPATPCSRASGSFEGFWFTQLYALSGVWSLKPRLLGLERRASETSSWPTLNLQGFLQGVQQVINAKFQTYSPKGPCTKIQSTYLRFLKWKP